MIFKICSLLLIFEELANYLGNAFSSPIWAKVYLEPSIRALAVDYSEINLTYNGTDLQKLVYVQSHPEVQSLGENIMFCSSGISISVTDIMLSSYYQNQSEGIECFTTLQRGYSVNSVILHQSVHYNYPHRTGPDLTKGINVWNHERSLHIYHKKPSIFIYFESVKPIRKVYITKTRKDYAPFTYHDIQVLYLENDVWSTFGKFIGEEDLGFGGTLKFERKKPVKSRYIAVKQINTAAPNSPIHFVVMYIHIS